MNAVSGGAPTAAGMSVSPGTAMKCAPVYAAIRVVAEDVAKLPLILYRRRGDGSKIPDPRHPLYRLLKRSPNRWQSSFEWREMMQAHLELRGNAYSYIVRNGGGQVVELLPLHPDRVSLMLTPDGDVFYQITTGNNEPDVPPVVPRSEILHLRAMTLDGYHGVSTISWMRETIGLTMAAEQHAAGYFGNGARPDLVITSKGMMTPEQATLVRDKWEETYKGAKNAYRPAVLPFDLGIEKLSLTNKDSQFLELRGFQVSDIARAFRIPPHKIGDLSKATFSNIEHQALEYYQDGLMPRLERFESALMRDLLTEEEQDQYEIEFDFTRILRGDMKSTMEAIASGRNWGILNANEGRNWLNLPARDGGDEYLEPLNMVPAGSREMYQNPPQKPASAPEIPPEEQKRLSKIAENVVFLRRTVQRTAA